MALTPHAPPLGADGSGAAAVAAYEAFAPVYDRFTASYAHEAWLANIDALVRANGVRGGRLLDVACGTGKSCLPMLSRGWDVWACDISPEMASRARAKLSPALAERVFVADMRRLPAGLGRFDLVTCLNDALNHLLSVADLTAALCSMAGALRPGGLLVFDLNSRGAYREGFDDAVIADDSVEFRVSCGAAREPGLFETWIEAQEHGPEAEAGHRTIHQLQRYFSRDDVESALGEAGLRLAAVRGQVPGGRLLAEADEDIHPKVLYVARSPGREATGR